MKFFHKPTKRKVLPAYKVGPIELRRIRAVVARVKGPCKYGNVNEASAGK